MTETTGLAPCVALCASMLFCCSQPGPQRAAEPTRPAPAEPAAAQPSTTPAEPAPVERSAPSPAPPDTAPVDPEPPPLAGTGGDAPAERHPSAPPSAEQPAKPAGADETALRRAAEEAQDCYAYSVGRDLPAGSRGTLSVDVGIASSGAVIEAAARPSASSKALMGGRFEQCVVDAVRGQRFAPSSREERWILAPFEFSPNPAR